jgi:hypothetical protein
MNFNLPNRNPDGKIQASMHHAANQARASKKSDGARFNWSEVILSRPVARFVRSLAISFGSKYLFLATKGAITLLFGTGHEPALSISLFLAFTHCRVGTWAEFELSSARFRSLSSSSAKGASSFPIGLSLLFTIFHISDVLMF